MLPISGKDKALIVRQTVQTMLDDDGYIVFRNSDEEKKFRPLFREYVSATLDIFQQRHALAHGQVTIFTDKTAAEKRYTRALKAISPIIKKDCDGLLSIKHTHIFHVATNWEGREKFRTLDGFSIQTPIELYQYFQDFLERKYGWIIEPVIMDRSADPTYRERSRGHRQPAGSNAR